MFNKSIVLAVGLGLCSMVQAGGCRDNKVLPGVSYAAVAQDDQADNGAGVFERTTQPAASTASNYTDEFQRPITVDNGQQRALTVPTRTQKVIHYLNTHKKHITVATLVAIVTAYAIIKRGYMKQYALAWWQKFKQRFYRR